MVRRAALLLIGMWERFFAPDPGLLRLQFALRVLASISITLFTLILLDSVITVPFGAYGLGFLVAQFTAVSVRDPEPRRWNRGSRPSRRRHASRSAESEAVTAMERMRAAVHMLARALAGTFRD